MQPSEAVVAFIASFEGFRARPYKDSAGVWTQGYGHTKGVKGTSPICTRNRAMQWMTQDVREAADQVDYWWNRRRREKGLPGNQLEQHRFDALVSFTYNLGIGNLLSSTLFRKLVQDPSDKEAPKEFLRWDKARNPATGNLAVLPGLRGRRRAEMTLYTTGRYATSDEVSHKY